MDTLVRNATLRFSRWDDGYEPLNPTDQVSGRRRDGDHGSQVSFSRLKSYRDHDHGGDHGGIGLRKISRPKIYGEDKYGDRGGLSTFPMPKSYRNHEHGSRRMFSRPKSYRNHENMMMNSFNHRRDRARNRHIFLQSYKLASMESARKSKTKRLKRVVVKVKSLAVSVLAFIRGNSLRSCNSRSAERKKKKGLTFFLHLSRFTIADGIASQKCTLFIQLILSLSTMNATPPQYMMLADQGSLRPPPYRRNVPRYNHHKNSRGCCFRCICCCYCLLFFLIFIVAGVALYFYAVYDPKVPSYEVSNFEVKAFDVQPDFSLKTVFLVTVKADNPNKGIGFIYGKDSSVVVFYQDSSLCSGKLPNFHQGPKNTSMIQVELKGKSEFGSGLQEAYSDSRKKGKIPLLVVVKAPVTIVVGDFPTKQFVVHVNCSLVVDNLSPNKKIGILSSAYTFDVTL